MAHMARLPLPLLAGAALVGADCLDTGSLQARRLVLKPVLDSLFIADTLQPPLAVTYYDDHGDIQAAGPIQWLSTAPSVATVSSSGQVVGVGKGFTVIAAYAHGVTGQALIAVSRPLDVTVLLDTIYLLPGDSLTVPVQVLRKAGRPPESWFAAAPNGAFTIDSATGLINAASVGGPFPFIAHADTVADTGWVEVREPTAADQARGFYTIFGTVVRRHAAPVQAVNYERLGDTLTFRLDVFDNAINEHVVVTLRSAVTAPGQFVIDSISPLEASGPGVNPICRPPRSWATWSTAAVSPSLSAWSRAGGSLTITRLVSGAGGQTIGGRFDFRAQREGFYSDPLGVLAIRGTFVALLSTDTNRCP